MRIITLMSCLALAACATPVTTLHAPNGEAITCGGSRLGSVSGGLIGYTINRSIDDKCVKDAIAKGAR